ncbi:hypothetical protein E5S70_26955 [Ensifer adhaerens]|uniref:hypothetical protein n=1 Tax=Ensifer canadensis TaxID=555315 RepID=UPI0014905F88|nr:hypothetical protein [Ensifer canadensis]NOV19670.1 hypothetical protein [Ensifer canadensis]
MSERDQENCSDPIRIMLAFRPTLEWVCTKVVEIGSSQFAELCLSPDLDDTDICLIGMLHLIANEAPTPVPSEIAGNALGVTSNEDHPPSQHLQSTTDLSLKLRDARSSD